MIWTRIRTSPSNWGVLLWSVVPYTTYCFVRKSDFDCQQLHPTWTAWWIHTNKKLSEHLMDVMSWTGSRNTTSYMAKKKHKRPQRMHQLYIFLNFGDIYLISENNCSKEGTDHSNLGTHASKHKLYHQIGDKSSNYCKMIYSVKVKMC